MSWSSWGISLAEGKVKVLVLVGLLRNFRSMLTGLSEPGLAISPFETSMLVCMLLGKILVESLVNHVNVLLFLSLRLKLAPPVGLLLGLEIRRLVSWVKQEARWLI